MPGCKPWVLLSMLLFVSGSVLGKGTYLTLEQFLQSAFGEQAPVRQKFWLKTEQRETLQDILGHPVGLRLSYWQMQNTKRSAWVFEEIGKELPITIGIVIEDSTLVDVRILAFRESRGGEVRYPFFTRQFVGLKLTPGHYALDQSIDGISGATMSVDAVTRSAEAALYLDSLLQAPQ